MEPFLCHIQILWVSPGIPCSNNSHKIAAYADDLIFFITNHNKAIPVILEALDSYSQISNFKIKLLKINVAMFLRPKFRKVWRSFPFKLSQTAIKYLGVHITSNLMGLFTLNYQLLAKQIRQDLSYWSHDTLTWFSRNNVLKMNIMSCILYLMKTVPCSLPRGFLHALHASFLKFIWSGKRHHRETVSASKTTGA